VTAPIKDDKITVTGINTNTSTTVDENSYIYLPNGVSLGLTPVLTSDGIDSRAGEDNKYVLVEGEDYTAVDSHTDGAGIGVFRYTFGGGPNGLYTTTTGNQNTYRYVEYRIFPKDLSGIDTDNELSVSQVGTLVYNGTVQKPTLNIVYTKNGESETLEEGIDYTVGSGNRDAGDYQITVTGKGTFTGSFTFDYTIEQFDLSAMFTDERVSLSNNDVVQTIADQTFNSRQVEPKVNVYTKLIEDSTTWTALANPNSYTVLYTNNDKVGTGSVTIEGQGNYKGTVKINFEIVQKDISDDSDGGGSTTIASIASQTYTGFEIEPDLTVKSNGVELVKGTDYTVAFSNNINTKTVSGETSKVTVTGIGNYKGEKTTTFTIVQADLKDVTIDPIPDQYYCNTKITPDVTVSLGKYSLIENTDFTVLYGSADSSSTLNYNIEDGGIVTIVPVSNSNFMATETTAVRKIKGQEASFNIVKKNISKKADDVKIVQSDGSALIDGKIYVNKSGVDNSTLTFYIEAVNSDSSECEDIVFANAYVGQSYYKCEVVNLDATKGNKAALIVSGLNPGTTKITLATQKGFTKDIVVVVNSPATKVGTSVYDVYNEKTVTASNQLYSVYENHEYQLSASLTPSNSTDTVSWSVSDDSIATIDENGLLKTLDTGTVEVKVITNKSEVYPGGVSNVINIFVNSNTYAENITIDNPDAKVLYGRTINLNGTATRQIDDITEVLEWTSSDENVAPITAGKESSKVTFKGQKLGKSNITYGSKEEDKVRAEGKVTVYAPMSDYVTVTGINTDTSTQTDDSYIYLPNGKGMNINPVLTSSGIDSRAKKDGSYTLVKDTDYTEVDSHKDGDKVGNYSFTFTGGESELYTGNISKTYKIWPKSIKDIESDETLSVSLKEDVIYNGTKQQPNVEITYTVGEESETLVAGTDYTITGGATDVGDYEVTVTGKGNFTGSFTYKYSIKPFDLGEMYKADRVSFLRDELEKGIKEQVFNGSKVEPAINLYVMLIEGKSFTQISNSSTVTYYKVEYSNNDKVGKGKVTISGEGNYTGTFDVEFDIVQKDISNNSDGGGTIVVESIPTQYYTGAEVEPELNVTCNGNELVRDKDYEVEYVNNIDSKTVSNENSTAVITGIGDYKGTITKTFVIEQVDLSDTTLVTIDKIPTQYYCSALITPEITVRLGDYVLVEGVDYEVSYGDNNKTTAYNYNKGVNAGVVTITPISKGNFKASSRTEVRGVNGQEARFNIADKEITKQADDVTIKNADGTELSDGNIYVNKAGVENDTLEFLIEAVNKDGSVCDDVVFATSVDSTYFKYEVVNLDATVGNKAIVRITGIKPGISTITLNTQKGFSKRVNVIVNSPATEVKIDILEDPENSSSKLTEAQGVYLAYEKHEYYLKASYNPTDSTDTVTWSVDNEKLASVAQDGKLTLKEPGTVKVKATTNSTEVHEGGVTKEVTIVIQNNILVEEAEVTAKDLEAVDGAINITYGETTRLSGSAKSSEGEVTEKLVWTSSDENVIKITEGADTGLITIEAVGAGTATIYYGSILEGGVTGSMVVNVVVPVSAIALDKNEASVIENETITLTATLNEYAVDGFVWDVSNKLSAEISGDDETVVANSQTVTIKGLKAGKTVEVTVKAKSDESLTSSCKITIVKDPSATSTPRPTSDAPATVAPTTTAPAESAAPTTSDEPKASAEATAEASADASANPGSDSTTSPADSTAPEAQTTAPAGSANATAAPGSTANPGTTAAPGTSAAPATPAATQAADDGNSGSTKVGASRVLSAKNNKPGRLTVRLKAVKGARYQLWYALSRNFKKGRKIKVSAKPTVALSRLKKGKTYFLKVRTFKVVNGKKVYSKFSKVRAVRIRK
nr:Ig-like domain-containing protein [Butyrivibrio sp.]